MTNDRLEALTVREDKSGRSFWTRIGVAWPNKNGPGYIVRLDAVPAPVEGQFVIHLREPKAREEESRQRTGQSTQRAAMDDLDDEVPF